MEISDNKRDLSSCNRKYAFVFVLLLFGITPLFVQSLFGESAISGKKLYSEEIYVRTDRDIYIAGEEVFLKVYCFSRLTHYKSGISSVAYASLLDRHNNPVLQIKIYINGLSGSGYFVIPDSLSTGNYYIATCTHLMQNFSPELYSYKCISVINPFSKIDFIKVPVYNPVADTVIFYPESGSIISDVENVIGFRSFGVNMESAKIQGFITDSSNKVICDVRSDENGYGIFRLIPPAKNRLYFKQVNENLISERFELPGKIDSGIALSVTEEKEKGIFRVRIAKGNGFNVPGLKLNLICEPVSLEPFLLGIDPLPDGEVVVSQNSLPAGLSSLILADDKGHRYAQRWIYNDKTQTLSFTVNTDKQSYSAREKVKVDITTTGILGKPVKCDLLVSAANLFSLTDTVKNADIDMQITGLPSGINKSGSFGINDQLIFLGTENDLKERYGRPETPVNLPEPDGHIISGVIKNSVSGDPLAKENIVLSFVGKTALCRFTKTDENGRFIFVAPEDGIRELVIQPVSSGPDQYFIELDNPFPDSFSRSYPNTFTLDTGMLEVINNAVISMQVKRIYDSSLPAKPESPAKTSINDFFGRPDYTTRMSNFIQLASLREAIKEIVPGAVTTSRKGKTVINTIYKNNLQIETRNPLVIVDGVPVFDHEKVLNITGDKIEKIDVLNTEYIISGIALGGIINITTYDGDLSVIEFEKPVFRQEFEAMRGGSDFNCPDYSDLSQKESRIPDFRNTLYWNPEVETDENGHTVIEFYSSDQSGDYRLLVEGFTSDGKRGSAIVIFSVTGDKRTPESLRNNR